MAILTYDGQDLEDEDLHVLGPSFPDDLVLLEVQPVVHFEDHTSMDRVQKAEDREQSHAGPDHHGQCGTDPKEYLANLAVAEDARDRSRDPEGSHASTTAAECDYLHHDAVVELVLAHHRILQLWKNMFKIIKKSRRTFYLSQSSPKQKAYS